MGPDVTGAAGIGQENKARLFDGKMLWVRGRWWYKFAHVCQRWRSAVLAMDGGINDSSGKSKGVQFEVWDGIENGSLIFRILAIWASI
jgi:hypothetical protein